MAEGAPGQGGLAGLMDAITQRREKALSEGGEILNPRNMNLLVTEIHNRMKKYGEPFSSAFDWVFNSDRWQKPPIDADKRPRYAEFAHDYFKETIPTPVSPNEVSPMPTKQGDLFIDKEDKA